MYLVIMVLVIVVITAATLPALLLKKCPGCGVRNMVDAPKCKKCGWTFPEEE